MTIFGKVLAFILVVSSIVGLGVAFWLVLDHRDWKKEVDTVTKEIQTRLAAQAEEKQVLRVLLKEKIEGSRPVGLPQANPADPLRRVSVREAKVELVEDEKKINGPGGMAEQVKGLEANLNGLYDQVKTQRTKTELSLKEHERLRKAIQEPEVNGQRQKGYPERIAEAREAQKRAEQAQEDLKPYFVNALVDLGLLAKRYDQLFKRAEQLKTSTSAAQPIP